MMKVELDGHDKLTEKEREASYAAIEVAAAVEGE